MTSSCPEIDCAKVLDSSLPPEQQERLEQHLESCVVCQERLDRAERCADGLRKLARQIGDPTTANADPALREMLARLQEVKSPLHSAALEPADLYFLRPSERPDLLGTLGIYEVQEVIGQGGMGVVLKAFEPALHRHVAIKVLAAAVAGSATARRRFAREAQAAAAVCHDHVVTVHAVSEADGLPYLVMQYVAGESLQARIDRNGPLELMEVVRIGHQTAAGLAAAHAQGLIHRDIKPANLLLENGLSRVKITDFGLARLVDDVGLTQDGVVAGTPEYMAPEQARGEAVDHRADLFSLGSVLYVMCTGLPPFRSSSTLALLRAVSERAATPVRTINPDVPAWLEGLIERLLAKNPAERFQSATEVATLLEAYLAHLREPATVPAPLFEPSAKTKKTAKQPGNATLKRALPFVLLLLLSCCLLVGLAAWWQAGGAGAREGGANPKKASVPVGVHGQVAPDGKASFDVARASRPIRGVIRDKATGKPVVGVEIGSAMGREKTLSDKAGRYELLGLPRLGHYLLRVRPASGQPYFGGALRFDDTPGTDPLTADIELLTGIPLQGRITDKSTGQPIPGARVDYHPLFPNAQVQKLALYSGPTSEATTGPDGTFAIVVLPGPGVLGATGPKRESYMPALVTVKELQDLFKDRVAGPQNNEDTLNVASGDAAIGVIVQQDYHSLVLLDIEERAQALKRDIVLEPARTLKGSIAGPGGKPAAGVTAYGLTFRGSETLKTESFTVQGLNPRRTRRLVFLDMEKRLGAFVVLRGSQTEPLAIKLQPCGSVTGRIVGKDGQPVPGMDLMIHAANLTGREPSVRIITGSDGRFRADGLVPGPTYMLHSPSFRRVLREVVVESGKNKELGDIDGHMEDRLRRAADTGPGERPANRQVTYAKEYVHSFKEDADLPADFTWDGLDPANCLEYQRDGLRLVLPAGHQGKRMGTGLASTFPVQGDFEITLTFEMLREPEPANTGQGSAVYLWVDSNTPPINRAMIMRGVNPVRGKDFSTWIDLKNVPGKLPLQYSNAAPAASSSGRLRLVRTGSMLAQYAAEGSSEEFRFLGNHPLGTDDVLVRIGGFTGGPKAALEARLSDLRIRAGALPDMPAAEQVAGKGAALVIVLVAFLAMSLTFGVVWLAVRSRRSTKRQAATVATEGQARPETASAPASVSFRCSGCGRSSKAKAEWAGKKAKCPHCGQLTLIPKNSTGIVAAKDADLSS